MISLSTPTSFGGTQRGRGVGFEAGEAEGECGAVVDFDELSSSPYPQVDASLTLCSRCAAFFDRAFCACCPGATGNAKTVLLSIVLFSLIAFAQVAGALVAGSMALLADCLSMVVDVLSYAGNLWAECYPSLDSDLKVRSTLVSSGASFLAILLVSVYFLASGIVTLSAPTSQSAASVEASIVFGFAIAGILFDFISIVPYVFHISGSQHHERLNLTSALSHVSADLLRSTSTLVESIILWNTDLNQQKVDAVTTIVVTATILCGVAPGMLVWFRSVRAFVRGEHELPRQPILTDADSEFHHSVHSFSNNFNTHHAKGGCGTPLSAASSNPSFI